MRFVVVICVFSAFSVVMAAAPKKVGRPVGKAPRPTAENVSERDPEPIARAVDAIILRDLATKKIPPSAVCTDAEFLRRASLDLIGRIPTAIRVEAFLADTASDKRKRLIDELLANQEFGEHFGAIWYHLLIEPNDDNRQLIRPTFGVWLAAQFNQNRPWDQIVRDILLASGARDKNPATVFWLSHVEGAQQRELKPAQIAGAATQRFLGTQYQCAECHNHPFTGFKQTEFWSLAAFFGKTEVDGADKKQAKSDIVPRVLDMPRGQGAIAIPESKGKLVVAKLPDGGPLNNKTTTTLREDFANWLTAPKNKAFSQSAVNRLWGHFFGRGVVHPVDDFRDSNPPSHPDLLEKLADEFRASGFDQKHLIRCICLSEAYQRSSDTSAENADDERGFSHMRLKLMSTDTLMRSLSQAMGRDAVDGNRVGKGEAVKKGGSPREQFLRLFDTADERTFSAEYSHGIPQALRLMNGAFLKTRAPIVAKLANQPDTNASLRQLYLATLSRLPTDAEIQAMSRLVAGSSEKQQGLADAFWVLLNTSEFVMNH